MNIFVAAKLHQIIRHRTTMPAPHHSRSHARHARAVVLISRVSVCGTSASFGKITDRQSISRQQNCAHHRCAATRAARKTLAVVYRGASLSGWAAKVATSRKIFASTCCRRKKREYLAVVA